MVAVLALPGADYAAALVDISRTGARLRCEVVPQVGQQLTFRAEGIQAFAEVVRHEHERGTCAIEFDTPIAVSEVQKLRWVSVEKHS